eukprot:2563867-Prymnesium_polylepis.2
MLWPLRSPGQRLHSACGAPHARAARCDQRQEHRHTLHSNRAPHASRGLRATVRPSRQGAA